ncbi:MAG: glycoside hydrolase family 3 N-terminal domain-containing protein, partial [Bacteroidota bacterium]
QAQKKSLYQNKDRTIEERVSDLLSKMSLEEKVAQMRIFHANIGVEANEKGDLRLTEKVREKLKLGIGGIKNPGEHMQPEDAARFNNSLQRYIIENNRWGIPALFVTESYNGVDAKGCTKFARPINSAASFNPRLVNRIWDVVGREARLRGMHMCHSPVADLVRDPRFGRMSEAFGEDTYLTTQMISQAVKGVQGDYKGLGDGTHIGAVVKHFAGYGQIAGGRNFASIEMSPRTLWDEIFPPFQAAVEEASALGIMASHGDINGIASHGSEWLLTDVLRDQWNFKGYVVSDANDIGRLHYFMKVAETPEAAAKMGLVAGVDIDLYAEDAYALLPEMAQKDTSLIALIDRSAARVLRTKFILGLFDRPYVDVEKAKSFIHSEENLQLALEGDLESIILLKNNSGTLPLKATAKTRIALLGPLLRADTQKVFESEVPKNVEFVSDKGFKLTDGNTSVPKLLGWDETTLIGLLEKAKTADKVILFLGGDEFTAKEAYFNGAIGDRATLEPVGPQNELLRRVGALGKPTIVILKHRRTLTINTFVEQADAILDCWDLSEMGNRALAKIIFGQVSPSGKLPVTVPRSIGQIPFHYSQKEINTKKGYLFLEDGPLFPFGHGLSYGNFSYEDISLSSEKMRFDSEITVSVKVSNTGSFKAKEVVQLYLKDEIGSVTRPDKELKGFKKIELDSGHSKTITFTITPDMLKFTGPNMERMLESGDYTVMVGTSSNEVLTARFRLEK